jgi:hypothetical protein
VAVIALVFVNRHRHSEYRSAKCGYRSGGSTLTRVVCQMNQAAKCEVVFAAKVNILVAFGLPARSAA